MSSASAPSAAERAERSARRQRRAADQRRQRAEPVPASQIQRGGAAAPAQEQVRPRRGTVERIGAEHLEQRQVLEMFSLCPRVEPDLAARRAKPETEIDVLEPATARIEPADVEERLPPDGSEAGPEGFCRPGARRVHAVME